MTKRYSYLLNSLQSRVWLAILHVAEASRLVALLDRNSRADHVSEDLEGLVQLLVGPLVSESLDENVTLGLDRAKKIFVVGQSSASLAVQLGELDLL